MHLYGPTPNFNRGEQRMIHHKRNGSYIQATIDEGNDLVALQRALLNSDRRAQQAICGLVMILLAIMAAC
jgi:hypothetical protein